LFGGEKKRRSWRKGEKKEGKKEKENEKTKTSRRRCLLLAFSLSLVAILQFSL